MLGETVYWANSAIKRNDADVNGEIVELDDGRYYRISNYDRMPPFLTAVISSSEHWMYVSSSGGLTCGRRNPDNALFPYQTDDRIHDAITSTGPETHLLVEIDDRTYLWKPLCGDVPVYALQRNLYKSLAGHRLIFEEENHDLGMVFSYGWSTSERFGFVRTATVRNLRDGPVRLRALDGLRNMLPPGVGRDMQSRLSTLMDAYKQAEIDPSTRAAIFSLTATPSDGTEPLEQLRASVAWCVGFKDAKHLLSEEQTGAFCAGLPLKSETSLVGQRGNYFVEGELTVPPGECKRWTLVADTGLSASDLAVILDLVAAGVGPEAIEADVESGHRRLWQLVGEADGCQVSADNLVSGRHFANTLFNIMRGGTFIDGYRIPREDFLEYLAVHNVRLRDQGQNLIGALAEPLTRGSLLSAVRGRHPDLERLALEYLPLTFSRRHGDPSRPWNDFDIVIRNPDGTDKLNYQGNWRDIFQNWEALALSFPEFLEGFIVRFLNASTIDGYNPYRINRDGFDWEVPEPDDPWSNIGYWGDHQVIYLLRLLELAEAYHPGRLEQMLVRRLFVYADVPYTLKSYEDLLKNPRDSVIYDHERARRVAMRVEEVGADGRLATRADGSLCRVSLLEKLLVLVLCKLGNFVPGGGIWMNTQRPEWNDANNALVGFGLSMVTLCQLRRMLVLLVRLIEGAPEDSFETSEEVAMFFHGVGGLLGDSTSILKDHEDEVARRKVMDQLGALASDYRDQAYRGISGKIETLGRPQLLMFLDEAREHLERTIRLNRRADGLYHSYNLIRFSAESCQVEHLPKMLEGQVAAAGSGALSPEEILALLSSLRTSSLYCKNRNSYLLYPRAVLPEFQEKNLIPKSILESNAVIGGELQSGRREIVEQDTRGNVRFNPDFRCVSDLRSALAARGDSSRRQMNQWCEVYESVFRHREYTGRSGTMFKYEGLGSIYWHMVSKLTLAVAEVVNDAADAGADNALVHGLADHFHDIKAGLGLHNSPSDYGAIPLEPHSHTPEFAGAQQPGMTGQVKEDILVRFQELGICVSGGVVSFRPCLLDRNEFVSDPKTNACPFSEKFQLASNEKDSLAFTLCGTPVIYRLAESAVIRVILKDGQPPEEISGSSLGRNWSRSLFRRENRIERILVDIPRNEPG